MDEIMQFIEGAVENFMIYGLGWISYCKQTTQKIL